MTSRDDALGEPFSIDVDERDGRSRITLLGAFGAECAERFKQQLSEVQASEPDHIQLDLSHLTFIDSTGVGVIMGAHNDCQDRQIGFTVVRGSGVVQRVLELSGLHQVLPMVDSPSV